MTLIVFKTTFRYFTSLIYIDDLFIQDIGTLTRKFVFFLGGGRLDGFNICVNIRSAFLKILAHQDRLNRSLDSVETC